MDREQALLQAVLAEPDRDEPRLIYADWCDENGDPDRAEFIRVQCRMAELEAGCLCGRCVKQRGGGQHHNGPCAVNRDRTYRPFTLRHREQQLLEQNTFADFPAWVQEWWFTRGFVSHVSCTCKDWLEHGPTIVQQQPLDKVTLSDRVPFKNTLDRHWWFGSGQKVFEYEASKSHLPHKIWLSFSEPLCDWHGNGRWYQSATEAMTALSTACLAYAHSHQPV